MLRSLSKIEMHCRARRWSLATSSSNGKPDAPCFRACAHNASTKSSVLQLRCTALIIMELRPTPSIRIHVHLAGLPRGPIEISMASMVSRCVYTDGMYSITGPRHGLRHCQYGFLSSARCTRLCECLWRHPWRKLLVIQR